MWRAHAVFISVVPSADASLIELAPTNNNGGHPWVPSGRTQNGWRTRALFKFDLISAIPTNATVLSAAAVFEVTGQPSEPPANSAFSLYRILRPWGEGNKFATNPPGFGQGMPASPGEVTWLHSFYPSNEWSAPGGAFGVDFSATSSSFQFIYGVSESPYRFASTPEMVGDVQGWVNEPQSNFGWILICDDEGTIFTARRFASREDTDAMPRLEIEYLVPPRIDSAKREGNNFTLSFTTWPGQSYTVEFRDSFSSGTWQPLTSIGLMTNATLVLIVDTVAAPQRFYRLVSF